MNRSRLVITEIDTATTIERRADKERRQIVRLLWQFTFHVTSAIESNLVPGTGEPDPTCAVDTHNVYHDRRDLKLASELIERLTPGSDRSKPNTKRKRVVAKRK